jgi:RND superfamily putative drug exporter
MKIAETILRKNKVVIVVWAIIFLALLPAILNYSNFVSYSVNSHALDNSESARAQNILSKFSPQNSSLTVVVQKPNNESSSSLANRTLEFQNRLRSSKIAYYTSSESAFSDYSAFLNSLLLAGNVSSLIRNTYSNFSSLADEIYSFPNSFLGNWSQNKYSQNSISSVALRSGYNRSDAYESIFINLLNQSFLSNPFESGPVRVQNAAQTAAVEAFSNNNPLVFAVIETPGYNVTNYRTDINQTVAEVIEKYSGRPVTTEILEAVLSDPSNPGDYYVEKFGLLEAPSFLTQNLVSPDNTTFLIIVRFNVTEDYRGQGNFYPAENATVQIRNLSKEYFGNDAQITGQGAITYDTAKLSSSSGYVFGLTFIFLAIAVSIVLGSLLSPILALIFVSLATSLGYVSIYLTGMVFGRVDFTVTYTLTAVILGVSTDYFVFILSRYREELRSGKKSDVAILNSTRKAGLAVLISGLTVAGSLGALSFVSDLRTWGPVLFVSILLTVALETTLLPAVVSLIGPRLFVKRTIGWRRHTPIVESNQRMSSNGNSIFYRTTKFSERYKFAVVAIIILFAIPAALFWFNIPTTYDFNEGLPKSLPSVQSLNTIDQKFGSNLIYPDFVIVNFSQDSLSANGSLTSAAQASLDQDAQFILGLRGVREVLGPTVNGTQIGLNSQSSQFIFNNGLNAYFIVFTNYDPYSNSALSVVKELRSNNAFIVGGLTSSVIDLQNYYSKVYSQLEILILIVIAVILGISFRSLKYPLISLSGVLVSIVWTTVILYVVSEYILGQQLIFLIPIVLYVILMALGNDFTVFIFSRIKEEQTNFGFTEGLARAMAGSASVVTALGLILAVSLGSLALVPFGFLEQLGIAFIVGLVIDTFVIRTFYFPAMISLLRKTKNSRG